MPYLVAVLGFDERHVIKSILRIGFKNVIGLYLIVPSGRVVKQTEEAIRRIREIAGMAGVASVEVFEVDPLRFEEAVARLRSLLMKLCAGGVEVIVSLGGGMRALVVESLTASILLPRDMWRFLRIVSDLETGEGYVEFVLEDVMLINELRYEELMLINYVSERGSAGPTDISRDLSIPKTTAWKALNKLLGKGLLKKVGREYRLTDEGVRLSSIAREIVRKDVTG